MDPRHNERTKVVQELYGVSFTPQASLSKKTQSVLKHVKEIEELIKKHAPKFPLEKIAKVDAAILKLAIFELTVEKKEPPKVVINEAVELAREMGSERSYSFVNAVLGKVYEEKNGKK